MPEIFGLQVDKSGRCQHWHGENDVVANQCASCQQYFACYLCHNVIKDHEFMPNPWHKLSVMCGNCRSQMTGNVYRHLSACSTCQQPFNPGCHLHAHLYFN